MSTAISYTVQVTQQSLSSGNAGGYVLNMTVQSANLIDTNVFIYQSQVLTPGGTTYEDFWYSVASVYEMATLGVGTPNEGSTFYRTNTMSMVFPDMADLVEANAAIQQAIADLCTANDAATVLAPAVLVTFPATAGLRYWGTSSSPTVNTAQILDFAYSEPAPLLAASHTYPLSSPSAYLIVAFPAILGAGKLVSASGVIPTTIVTQSFVDPTGLTQDYHVLATTEVSAGNLVVQLQAA